MAELDFGGSAGGATGSLLKQMLMCEQIEPGSEPGYEICKIIYEYHPLGAKMVDAPVKMAMSQPREITIGKGPEAEVRQQFLDTWANERADRQIANTARIARQYGAGTLVFVEQGVEPTEPIDPKRIGKKEHGFNVLDPLNTAGSLVINQNPESISYQKTQTIRTNGKVFHSSRCCVILNEDPIYISYTKSAYGFVGRSVYQRALFPLKTYISTMITDDLVVKKSGLLIAMIKTASSIVDNVISTVTGRKRDLLKQAETGGVLSIGHDDKIESLNMMNLEGPFTNSRKNVLENIATAADMPAKILNHETFAEGFGEGTEDAKYVARFIDTIRADMVPIYDFLDPIIQRLAWTEEFYATIKEKYPEYADVPFDTAFYEWSNSFTATWPNLLTEPPSEKVKVDDVKLKACIALAEVLLPQCNPENKALLIEWLCDSFNELKLLFPVPINLDAQSMVEYGEQMKEEAAKLAAEGQDDGAGGGTADNEPKPPKPFADSAIGNVRVEIAKGRYDTAARTLIDGLESKLRPGRVSRGGGSATVRQVVGG